MNYFFLQIPFHLWMQRLFCVILQCHFFTFLTLFPWLHTTEGVTHLLRPKCIYVQLRLTGIFSSPRLSLNASWDFSLYSIYRSAWVKSDVLSHLPTPHEIPKKKLSSSLPLRGINSVIR